MPRKEKAAVATCRRFEMPELKASDMRPTVSQLEARRKQFLDDIYAYAAAFLMLGMFIACSVVLVS